MKKISVLFFLFGVAGYTLTGTAQDQPSKEIKFKNPIFYERMVPTNEGPSIILTPNYMIEDMSENDKGTGPCELLENEENYIVIQCRIYYPEVNEFRTYKSKYSIDPQDCWKLGGPVTQPSQEGDARECLIREDGYNIKDNRINSLFWYTVQQKQ